ncbi:DUF6771 family protein [Sphingomonas citri]|uniref:DUF6771 family protein n=1 Tax=Sphingomonas citri TaxID=2862499 RepID=UPI0027E53A62|nr:DUF6771 family protein [Sphingomonas citri]
MDTPSPQALASAVLIAPGWVRVGIAAPSPRLREEAALALANRIVDRLEKPQVVVPDGQLALPLA